MKKYYLELIVFIAGALIMLFELSGARVMGPYFGSSIFVWTSLIGIILGSLSIGYWLGGLVSLKRADYIILSWILLLASFFILITAISNNYILIRVVKYIPDFRLKTVVSSIVLFGPASVFLGMVLPYAVRLKIIDLQTSGSTVGNFYALSTAGSIIGTFLAGFFLIPVYGFANILYFISAILIVLSFLLFIRNKKLLQSTITIFLTLFLVFFWIRSSNKKHSYIDIDTQYNRVLIYNTTDINTGRPIKMLNVNDEKSSAMFTDKDDDLVFEVLKYYRLIEHFNPEFEKSLMIGGSGYAFPKDFLRKYPEATIDVVEIDPGLTELAKIHFNLPDDPGLTIYHEDGRTFLNRTDNKYDAVFMDAYKSMITIPYQLTTKEAVQRIYEILNKNGVVFANLISSLDQKNNRFLRAELATYQSVFPQVYLFAVQYPDPSEKEKEYFQNIMLVGLKSPIEPQFTSTDTALNKYLQHRIIGEIQNDQEILTDEYAPVEYYTSKVLK